MTSEIQLLKNSSIFPSNEVIQSLLQKNTFAAYQQLVQDVTNVEMALSINWQYYNDGKAWLCKVVYKKKTIFWLSVWEQYIKTSFFFTEKHLTDIAELDIAKSIKDTFAAAKPVGRLIPLILDITKEEQLTDFLKIVQYKKSLK